MAKQVITKNGTTWGAEVDKLNGNFDELYTGVSEAIPLSQKGATNGVASLVNGTIPASQLPSYVDDVLEYANLAGFPATGESGKLYVAIDTNLVYRWSGSTYTRVDQTDLTNYVQKDGAKVLSTNDYTNADKLRVADSINNQQSIANALIFG